MAATVTEKSVTITPSKRKLVCFSLAAYANTVVEHLLSCNIAVAPGLSDGELSDVESSFSFSFPPDLRSLLQAGLPISHGFPNWRSSSHQQLALLLNLPSMSLLKEVSLASFWCSSWGDEPVDRHEAVAIAREVLDAAPVLIPLYRDLYIPASPASPGNPVFYVRGGDVRVSSFDLSGFFQEVEFLNMGDLNSNLRPPTGVLRRLSRISPPVWAATAARRIEVWTDVAETGRRVVARGETHGWWTGDVMGDRLEEVFWKLMDGGWSEEDVREMMAMDGSDSSKTRTGPTDVSRQVRVLAVVLFRAGWSREDVLYSLGYQEDENRDPNIVDFDPPQRLSNSNCSKVDVDE